MGSTGPVNRSGAEPAGRRPGRSRPRPGRHPSRQPRARSAGGAGCGPRHRPPRRTPAPPAGHGAGRSAAGTSRPPWSCPGRTGCRPWSRAVRSRRRRRRPTRRAGPGRRRRGGRAGRGGSGRQRIPDSVNGGNGTVIVAAAPSAACTRTVVWSCSTSRSRAARRTGRASRTVGRVAPGRSAREGLRRSRRGSYRSRWIRARKRTDPRAVRCSSRRTGRMDKLRHSRVRVLAVD